MSMVEREGLSVATDPAIAAYKAPFLRNAGGQYTESRRLIATNSLALTTGLLRLSFFTSKRTEPITSIRSWCGAAVAGATPTICKMGLWEVDDSGNLGSGRLTTNDTAMWNTLNTTYTKTLSGTGNVVAGRRYAAGALIVSAAAMPSLIGVNPLWYAAFAAEYLEKPTVIGCVSGLTDLAASYTFAQLTGAVGGNTAPIFLVL